MASEAARDRVQLALDAIEARIVELSAAPEIVRETAWQLSLQSSDATAELASLKVQRSVWTLLDLIAAEDVDDGATLPIDTTSHRALLEALVHGSNILQRAQSVSLWSEQGHRQLYKDLGLTIPLDWGTPYAQTLTLLERGQSLDPDSNASLHPDDARAETRFWRGIWQLVAGGLLIQAEPDLQLPSALQLCQAYGHDWRAVSLAGALPYDIVGDDTEGNWHRWLWRYTCRQMASSSLSSSNACQWQRAVYGLLGGDPRHVYPVCETWQEFVWAAFSCHAVLVQDADLHAHLRHTLDSRCSQPLDGEQFVERPAAADIAALMAESEVAYAEARPGVRKDSYHRVIKYLILNDVQQVYDELYTAMVETDPMTNRIYHRPSYIEFAFRLYTALNPDPQSDAFNARIAVEYVRYLSTAYDLQHLIPEATASLPDPIKVDEYAAVLRACTDVATRNWFLSQARARFTPQVVHAIHQRLLTMITPGLSSSSSDRSDSVMQNIADLVSCQSLDPSTALRQANAFFREFIAAGQYDHAQRLYGQFPVPAPSDSHSDDERELLGWCALMKARIKINDLERFLTKRPRTDGAGPSTVDERLDELQYGAPDQHMRMWEATRDEFFQIARRAVLGVIQHPGGWLRFTDSDRDRELAPLRQMCLPEIVTRIFAVCESMDAKHMNTCLDVVVAVADDGSRAYEAFDADRLQSLMRASRHVYLRYISAFA